MPLPTGTSGNKGQSLENLLVAKNRRLLDDLTRLRVANEELSTHRGRNEEMGEGLRQEVERLRDLNTRLEADLSRVNGEADKGLAGLDIGRDDVNPTDNSILPIVTSQRDRFRQRNAELEDELRRQFEIVADLRAEIKSLQADNLKLYEKVRYVNSYGNGPRATSSGQAQGQGQGTGNGQGGGNGNGLQGVLRRDEEMGRYKDKYEESMNPFEAFKGRVSAICGAFKA